MSGVWGPPARLRLVVLDAETTLDQASRRRAVAVGLVVCSGETGALSRQVSWLINPG